MSLRTSAKLASGLVGRVPTNAAAPSNARESWTEEHLFDQGDAFFDALIQDIDQAHTSIDLEVYIFDDDSVGRRVVNALIQARSRGVAIRVLIDGIGSYASSVKHSQTLRQHGVPVRVYHPLPWQWQLYSHSLKQGYTLEKALYFLSRINRRDHRKLFLIDRQRLWTGSFNLSRVHLPITQGGEGWRDFGVCISGPRLQQVADDFDHFWQQHQHLKPRKRLPYYWSTFSSGARHHKNRLLIKMIDDAQRRVWIMSAYFAPNHKVVNALKRAAHRHVDVRIILPSRSDVRLFPRITATYYTDLLKAGINIYEYQSSVLHAKVFFADDSVILGSTNFNHRSFLHDLELDIGLSKANSKQLMETWFLQDQDQSRRVTFQHRHISGWGNMLGWFSRLLRYWL